ncbi:hypothetical protein T492DRAFT_863817 [Pavlovales sp. CCMP2436]|nr:hypothetical protein T492DRAFT_863817 [Pavlovales sp. CCMP2436]
MDESEFAIPAGPADLAQEPGRFSMGKAADFSVRDAASVVSALENVRECADAAPAELALSERETLETVYSALRAFGGLHPKAIDTLRAILLDATERLLILVRRVARPGSSSDRELLAPRSALKLHVFLISWMLGAAAAREDDGASAVPAKGKGKGAASKGGKSWDRLATLVALSGALVTAAECELSSLWRLGAPEEPFLHLLTRGACALLERADLAKLPTLRGPALDLLSTVGGRYGQREQVVACCVDLLHKSEHSPAALAELVERLAGAAPEPTGDEADEEVDDEPTPGRGGGRGGKGKGPVSRRAGGSNGVDAEANERLLASLVRELAASATADGGADSAAARAVASFLVEAAERAPAVLLAHVATVAPQLASDSYTVRSGVVHALSLVLVHVSSQRRELAAQHFT